MENFIYKTELHAHSSPASSCSEISPEELVRVYKQAGYTSVVLTNHLIYHENENATKKAESFLKDYFQAKKIGESCGLNILLGAEIRFSESFNDYLVYGIQPEDTENLISQLTVGLDKFYKNKRPSIAVFQAHPCRDKMTEINPASIDGYEAFNVHPKHNARVGIACHMARVNGKKIIAGSDFHHPGQHALSALLSKEPVTSSQQLARLLLQGDYMLETSGFRICPV